MTLTEQLAFHFEDDEIWKPVVGYEGLYEVSNRGQVRSLDRQVSNGRSFYTKNGRILKLSKTTTGYWKIELRKDGFTKSFKVHRLVAIAFIPKILGKPLINHIDGNPLNNNLENLEWCNQSENMKHAAEMQLIPNNFNLYKEEIVKEYKVGILNIAQLSRKYGCSDKTIREYFKSNNIKIRGVSEVQDKYRINKMVLIQDFENGMRNVDIAKKHKTNPHLIGVYKHKYKKGELL